MQANPLGERIIVSGKVVDDDGHPVRGALIEFGRQTPLALSPSPRYSCAPLDPNFTGCGRLLTDAQGVYSFVSIKPGVSLEKSRKCLAARTFIFHFLARILSRLVTQSFSADPLFARDPIFKSIPDEAARTRWFPHSIGKQRSRNRLAIDSTSFYGARNRRPWKQIIHEVNCTARRRWSVFSIDSRTCIRTRQKPIQRTPQTITVLSLTAMASRFRTACSNSGLQVLSRECHVCEWKIFL